MPNVSLARPGHARRVNRAGCATILALPAALSLNHAALAQSVIDTDQAGVNLDLLSGPVQIAPGVSISANGWAAVYATQPGALSNSGVVSDAGGIGVALGGGGALSNAGSLSGTDGVRLGAAGSVANSGVIHGTAYGILVNNGEGVVSNTGQISAGDDGVSLNRGGTLTNSGSIFGAHMGVYTGNGLGVVENSGVITAQSGTAVSLYSGGTLSNAAGGQIVGGYSGVYAGGSGSRIVNAGLIAGHLFGAYLMGDSAVVNAGSLNGGTDGIIDIGTGGSVLNTGEIHGGVAGVQFAKGGSLDNAGTISGGNTGVKLGKAGTLVNATGGVIRGGLIGISAGAGSVIDDAGTVDGPTAISLTGGPSSVILETGAVIDGAIAGNGTASSLSLQGHGSLNAPITGFGSGSLTVQPGAVWTLSGNWAVGQVENDGTITAGLVGTPLSLQGNFTQGADGTLRVVVTPTGMSELQVSGTAHLAGTLVYVLSPGTYAPARYDFLTAGGGVSGDFSAVQDAQSARLAGTGSVQAVKIVGAAQTAVVVAAAVAEGASAAQTVTASQPVSAAPLVVTSSQRVAQVSIVAPLVVAPQDGALFADAAQSLALGGADKAEALLGHAQGAAGCAGLARQGSQAGNIATAMAAGLCRMGGWVQAAGTDLSADGAYDARGGGFLAGVDRAVGAGRVGLALGYDAQNVKDAAGGKASLQTLRVGLYGGVTLGRVSLSADAMEGFVSTSTTRATGEGAATAQGRGQVFSAALQAALPMTLRGVAVTPAVGLDIAQVKFGALSEQAAAQAFAVTTKAANGVYVAPYARISLSRVFYTASGLAVTPSAMLGVKVNATNPGSNVAMTAQDGTGFTATARHLAPVSGLAGLGLGVSGGNWSLTLRYNATLSGNWTAQSLQAGLVLKF